MPKPLPDLLAYFVEDCAASVTGLSTRSMFGGWGIYQHGVIFAIYVDGTLYFKVDAEILPYFAEFESYPFTYVGPSGAEVSMSYYALPESVMEDRDILPAWIERSVAVSRASRAKKKKPRER